MSFSIARCGPNLYPKKDASKATEPVDICVMVSMTAHRCPQHWEADRAVASVLWIFRGPHPAGYSWLLTLGTPQYWRPDSSPHVQNTNSSSLNCLSGSWMSLWSLSKTWLLSYWFLHHERHGYAPYIPEVRGSGSPHWNSEHRFTAKVVWLLCEFFVCFVFLMYYIHFRFL